MGSAADVALAGPFVSGQVDRRRRITPCRLHERVGCDACRCLLTGCRFQAAPGSDFCTAHLAELRSAA